MLGEQSAKSLRGKDMADVIFKGSGTSGRKPMNTAEATLVFDNADQRLPVDAPEVHVTRRVYRSGEGEYLINRQPCPAERHSRPVPRHRRRRAMPTA